MQLAETVSERALADEVRAFLSHESLLSADLPRALDDWMAVLGAGRPPATEPGSSDERGRPSSVAGAVRPSSR